MAGWPTDVLSFAPNQPQAIAKRSNTFCQRRVFVAVRLAGVDAFEIAYAGKPCCYGSWVVIAVFGVCIGLCLTAELFRLAAGYLEKPQVTKGVLLLAWP
jgi:hypothetical protein